MLIYLAANVVMYFMELGLMKGFIKMISIPKYYLFPFIIICCILGVFALNNRVFDIWVLVGFGIAGYLFTSCRVPMSPVIMGYLMGTTFETNFRRAMIAANGSFADIFTRPIAVVFVAVSALFVLVPVISRLVRGLKNQKAA